MLDFTSALYLGFDHASQSLPGWERLTLGKPGALQEWPETFRVERELAALTGCEQVQLGPSTLHLFSDLFAMLAAPGVAIWIDEAAYAVARWGADRAAARGVPVREFPRHDAGALWRALNSFPYARPVIVTDGYSPLTATHAPLREYAECAAAWDGLLIVDDTQALGMLGWQAEAAHPYGSGGGGSLRSGNLSDWRIVLVSSLAKAFGVPLAMLGGSESVVEKFRYRSESLVHCSPPSAATISAAFRALWLNAEFGDALRRRLVERVARFRFGVPDLLGADTWFPVQPIRQPQGIGGRRLYRTLLARGVRTVLLRNRSGGSRIVFLLTVRHQPSEIDDAVDKLTDALGTSSRDKGQRKGAIANG